MRRTRQSVVRWFAVGVAAAATVAGVACRDSGRKPTADTGAVSLASTGGSTRPAGMARDSAAGDVAAVAEPGDAAEPVSAVAGRWISDANALALVAGMAAQQNTASDVGLRRGSQDTVRALATSLARLGAGMQRSVDSVADRLNLTPAMPALAASILSPMRARNDSLADLRGPAFDRAFVRAQVANLATVADYAERLGAVSERPEVQSLMASVAGRAGALLPGTRALAASFAGADSVAARAAADSATRRAKRSVP